jgi:hypothetical protein
MASAFTPNPSALLRAIRRTGVGESDVRAFASETFYDGGADAAASSGDESAFTFE